MGKRDNGYFELLCVNESGIRAVLLAILALCYIGLPIIVILIATTVLHVTGYLERIPMWIVMIVSAALFFGWVFWLVISTKDPNRTPLFENKKRKRYYFNIPDAYKKVRIERLTDGDEMTGLYHDGAMFFADKTEDFLNYTFNFLNDNKLILNNELNVYEISREDFLKRFSYYEPEYFQYDAIYVVPYSSINTTRAHFKDRDVYKIKDGFNWLYYHDYADLVDGIYSEYGFGIRFRYRDIVK